VRGNAITVGELKRYLEQVPDEQEVVVGWDAEEVRGATWLRSRIVLGGVRRPDGTQACLIKATD
jgi:hypothetical protein